MARSVWRWMIGLAVVLVLGLGAWLLGSLVFTTDGAVALSTLIDSWDPVQDEKGGYAVEMPTKPIDTMTDLAQGNRAYGWTIYRPRYEMGVFYVDLPAAEDPQKVFAAMTEAFARGHGVKRVVAQRPITLGQVPGLEVEFAHNAGQTGIIRMYVRNNRFHYLQFVSTDWEASRVMRTRFFDSLRFLTPE